MLSPWCEPGWTSVKYLMYLMYLMYVSRERLLIFFNTLSTIYWRCLFNPLIRKMWCLKISRTDQLENNNFKHQQIIQEYKQVKQNSDYVKIFNNYFIKSFYISTRCNIKKRFSIVLIFTPRPFKSLRKVKISR